MRLKLDENLGLRCSQVFQRAGHDVATVADQNICSISDTQLIDICHTENRALVTLDLDFGNPLKFKPSDYSGIAVMRLPKDPSLDDLIACATRLIYALERQSLTGRLWIVQRNHVREYQEE